MSGPNSSSEWSIEGRRLVPLMPRLVPQTAFTVTANAVANAAVQHNASLPVPAETGNKEGVSCSDEDEKPRKRRRTNSSSSSPVVLKEVPKAVVPVSKTITVPVSGSPKMSNIMQSIANSLPPHMSPVKITFTKPSTQTTNSTTQKVCSRGNLCLPGAALISFSQCDSDLTNMHWVLTMCLALWWECSHLSLILHIKLWVRYYYFTFCLCFCRWGSEMPHDLPDMI